MKISVSLCLYLTFSSSSFFHCHRHWLTHSSFTNRWDRIAPLSWWFLMFYIFSEQDIWMRSVLNYLYVLDTTVCYPPTLQNLAPLNPDEHTPSWSSDHNSQSGSLGDDLCVYGIDTFCTVGGRHKCALFFVKGEGFHTHLVPPRYDRTLCNSERASSVKCSSSWARQQKHHSVEKSSVFGLVVFKVSSSGVGPNTAGISFPDGWSTLLHTMQFWVGLFYRILLLSWVNLDLLRSHPPPARWCLDYHPVFCGLEAYCMAESFSIIRQLSSSPSVIGILPSVDWISLSDGGISPLKSCNPWWFQPTWAATFVSAFHLMPWWSVKPFRSMCQLSTNAYTPSLWWCEAPWLATEVPG